MDGLRVMPVVNIELVYAISPLADEIWHEHYDSIIGEAQVDYMLEKFLSPEAIVEQINSGYEYFLFSYEYTFAGFASIHEKDGSMFLSKLYVHKDLRGKKIASYMLKNFADTAKLRGLDKIWLTCNKNNKNALEVYKHLGFEIVREEVTDIGEGYVMDDYVLEYKIS